MFSIRQQKIIRFLTGTFIVSCVWLSFAVLPDSREDTSGHSGQNNPGCTGLIYGDKCLAMEIVDNNQSRIKGLSGRDKLAKDQGMLFVFETPEEQCFWMKDMRFSLDIIWTDDTRQIIKIEKNVSPQTYPDSFCADDTKYVLEFNAGFADKHGLKVGEELKF